MSELGDAIREALKTREMEATAWDQFHAAETRRKTFSDVLDKQHYPTIKRMVGDSAERYLSIDGVVYLVKTGDKYSQHVSITPITVETEP